MKELERQYREDDDYRELFCISVDSYICEYTAVGITNDGQLLYIDSKLMNNSSAYWVQSVFYSINKDEFNVFFKRAESAGYIEKAIRNGKTTEEELKRLSE